MPAINFKSQFTAQILSGKKPFTLRAPRKDGRDPQAGQALYLFTAMRTKQCRKIAEKPCRLAVTVKLSWRCIFVPTIGDLREDHHLESFSRLDGFNNYREFCQFHEVRPGMDPKSIRLIAWVTREELKEMLEPKNVCYKPGICHCPACWLERQS